MTKCSPATVVAAIRQWYTTGSGFRKLVMIKTKTPFADSMSWKEVRPCGLFLFVT